MKINLQGRQRSSAPNVNAVRNKNGPPKPTVVVEKEEDVCPLTPNEKVVAQNDSELKRQYNQSQQKLQQELLQKNMQNMMRFCIYPPVKRLIAIGGDLHELSV